MFARLKKLAALEAEAQAAVEKIVETAEADLPEVAAFLPAFLAAVKSGNVTAAIEAADQLYEAIRPADAPAAPTTAAAAA